MKTIARMLRVVVMCAGLAGLLMAQSTTQSTPSDQGAKGDIKEAGHATGRAAKKTAHKTKQETKKAVHKGARQTRKGAQKVEDKTQTPPQ
jgi:hypothetical protein